MSSPIKSCPTCSPPAIRVAYCRINDLWTWCFTGTQPSRVERRWCRWERGVAETDKVMVIKTRKKKLVLLTGTIYNGLPAFPQDRPTVTVMQRNDLRWLFLHCTCTNGGTGPSQLLPSSTRIRSCCARCLGCWVSGMKSTSISTDLNPCPLADW